MRAGHFLSLNRPHWERLSELLDVVESSGLSSLTPAQIDELGRLYRRASTNLSEARTGQFDSETLGYLNQLVSRAYARIYAGGATRHFRLGHLFACEIPRTFRRQARYLAASVGVSLLAVLIAYLAVRTDPRWAPALTNPGAVEWWRDFARSSIHAGDYFAESAKGMGAPEFAGFLMSNNLQVALKAFAFGLSLGLGTLFVLTMNGLMLGAFLGTGANAGKLSLFTAIVAPHGVVELSAIFIAGAAGLMIGYALVDPGDYTRRDALRVAALEAVKLVLGTVPMFVVAGLIEGLISPQSQGLFATDLPRILFGLTLGAAFWLYLFLGDRLWGSDEAPETLH